MGTQRDGTGALGPRLNDRRMPRLKALRSILGLLHAQADRVVLLNLAGTLALVLLSGGLAACGPLALKYLVDAIDGSANAARLGGPSVATAGTIYLLVLLTGRLANDLRPLVACRVEHRVAAGIKEQFLSHVLRLPMGYLIKRRSGELLHSVDLATAGAQLMISHVTSSIAPVLVELAVMAFVLIKLKQPALVVLFATAAMMYLAIFAAGAISLRRPAGAVSAASLDSHAQLSEGITHVETLRSFGAEHQALNALRVASSRLVTHWLNFNAHTAKIALAASVVFGLTMSACFAISADAVAREQMTAGAFVLAGMYALQMVRPLEVLGAAARDLARTLGYVEPLLDILAEVPEPDPLVLPKGASGSKRPRRAPSIVLENLHFAYEPGRPILCGLSLEIPSGRTIALVGHSGSGKSTLARLLLRLYQPQTGKILLDGEPIEAVPATELRSLIGLVPQDAGLMHASAAANIALGVASATREDVRAAAQAAQVHHVIEAKPGGYDSMLGERGQTLSGGERQRLAIARALVRRPLIYLLDEPTSMLDSETEAEVMAIMRRVTAGSTTILIAHRLSTAMHADEIVVLGSGQIIERGSHTELIANGGAYARLWQQQSQAEPVEASREESPVSTAAWHR